MILVKLNLDLVLLRDIKIISVSLALLDSLHALDREVLVVVEVELVMAFGGRLTLGAQVDQVQRRSFIHCRHRCYYPL